MIGIEAYGYKSIMTLLST